MNRGTNGRKVAGAADGATVGYEAELWRMADALRGCPCQLPLVDKRKLDRKVDLPHREVPPEDITHITKTCHAWCGESIASSLAPEQTTRVAPTATEYRDTAGSCRSNPLDDIREHGHVHSRGRYVGAEVKDDDEEPFEQEMNRLVAELRK